VTISHKAAFSLLIAVVLFAVFTTLAFTGLFNLVEARFYNPSVTRALIRETELDAEAAGEFLGELRDRFAATLEEDAVRRSFLPSQSDEDIFERSRLYGLLHEKLRGLLWVRFVDIGGSRLHFSTFPEDILRRDGQSLAYRSYPETAGALPYDQAAVPNEGAPRLILDGPGDRIIFAYPFYDSFEAYRGTALFCLSIRAMTEGFITRGRIKAGEDLAAVSSPPGVLAALSHPGREALISRVADVWRAGAPNLSRIDSGDGGAGGRGTALVLFSARTSLGIYTGRLVDESLFHFPGAMKLILLAAFFLTVYLTVFLLFNLRQDSVTVVQNRLKRLQISLIEQFYDRKGEADWNRWSRELQQRREEIRGEMKRGLNFKPGRPGTAAADLLIDKSWDELTALIGGRRETGGPDREKLQALLNLITQTLSPGTAPPPPPENAGTAEEAGLEELESAEEPEAPEVLEAVDAGEAELEELESAEEPEALEVLEAADAGEAELEELESAEEPDAAEAPEAADAGEAELEELESVEEPEALEAPEAADAGEMELEELESVDEPEAPEAPEAAEEAGPEEGARQDAASLIEFSPLPENAEAGETPSPAEKLEIVSPFAVMRSKFLENQDGEETNDMEEGKK
jgi:hypothetical protein